MKQNLCTAFFTVFVTFIFITLLFIILYFKMKTAYEYFKQLALYKI